MDIATQMKLEDLKAEFTPLSEQLKARNEATVLNALQSAALDFKAHFGGLGFSVETHSAFRSSAKYQGLEFSLVSDDAPRIGCLAVIEVGQATPTKSSVSALIVRKGSKGPSVSYSSGPHDPVADLQKALVEVKAALAGPGLEVEFQVVEQKVDPRGRPVQHGGRSVTNYPTFAELLKDKFK